MKKNEIFCPVTATMNIIGGKWKAAILWYLRDKPMRFGELHRCVPGCSLKVFNNDLKDLERDGILKREVFAEVPPRVEYSYTEFGKTLLPVILVIRDWGVFRLKSYPELTDGKPHLKEMIEQSDNNIVTNQIGVFHS